MLIKIRLKFSWLASSFLGHNLVKILVFKKLDAKALYNILGPFGLRGFSTLIS